MPPPAIGQLSKLALAVVFVFSGANFAVATEISGITINNVDNNQVVSDTELNIGAGTYTPIFFNGSGHLTISFENDPGVVNISRSNWPESSIQSVEDEGVNLSIKNGSLTIKSDNVEAYASQGNLGLSWGGNVSIDNDLAIDLTVVDLSRDLQFWPYAAVLGDVANINVGHNTDITMRQASWDQTGTANFIGLFATEAQMSGSSEWNFGTTAEDIFRLHDIHAGSATGGALAYGIAINLNPESSSTLVMNINASAFLTDIHAYTKNTTDGAPYAIGAEVVGGELNFNGDLTIKNISAQADSNLSGNPVETFNSGAIGTGAEAYALGSFNRATININTAKNADRIIQIENDLIVADAGVINAYFLNESSHFIGTVATYNLITNELSPDTNQVNLSFADGAFWRLTASNNQLVELTLNNSAVYLDRALDGANEALTADNPKTLNLATLKGDDGIFYMRTSVSDVLGDSIYIGTGTGSHQLMLAGSGLEPTQEALDRALVTQMTGTPLSLTLANANGQVDLGNYVYGLTSRQTDGSTEWYLSNQTPETPEPEPEPDPTPGTDPDPTPEPEPSTPTLSPSATAVLALAGTGSQTSQFLYSLSDLRKRMGDVRYGAADGLYAGIRGGKDRISGFASTSFKNEYGAVSIGYDRKVNDNWIVGVAFEAIEGDQTVKNNGYRADGEDSTQSLKVYATWFNDIGCYADLVIAANRFDQDLSTHMLDGTKVDGSYNSTGFGASAEVGKKFSFGADDTWFIEPQAQLAYYRVQGEDFRLSNGMTVKQENADSLTGRLGVVAGRTFLNSDGTGYQLSMKAGVNHEFLGDADILVNGERFSDNTLDTRGYYGVGFDWYVSNHMRLFGQIEREEGSHYTSEINARVGVKYHF